jgi:hypothetical protein
MSRHGQATLSKKKTRTMTSEDPTAELRHALYAAFEQPMPNRYRYTGFIVIDDRSRKDRGADRRLFSWFCEMLAEVIDATTVRVTLKGNVPMGPAVREWLRMHKLGMHKLDELVFDVRPSNVEILHSLSIAIRSIVKRGARYDVPSYKYVCPRVAKALDRLRNTLRKHWRRVEVLDRRSQATA